MKPLESELAVARECALAASAVIRRHALGDRESWEKAEDNPVTHADLEANRTILAGIRESFPDDGILSEEKGDSDARFRSERVWIVDPLDGTKEFVARIPEFAVAEQDTADQRARACTGSVVSTDRNQCRFWIIGYHEHGARHAVIGRHFDVEPRKRGVVI